MSNRLEIEEFMLRDNLSASDFKLKYIIGYGASSSVWLAECKVEVYVAIKILNMDEEGTKISEVEKEIQMMTLCKCENIVRYYGSVINGSEMWLIMDYLEGGSCYDLLRGLAPSGLEEWVCASILHDALSGLQYLHKNGHIHRDIKAGNILIDSEGISHISDFGVSAMLLDHGKKRKKEKNLCWYFMLDGT